jgi:hypothetical protein
LGGKRAKHDVLLLFQRHNAETASIAENKTLKYFGWELEESMIKNYSKENKF